MSLLLETQRLIIKLSAPDNFENVFRLFSDPQVMRYVGHGVRTREESKLGLEKMQQHYDRHGFTVGDVYTKANNEFIGRAGLVYLELNDQQPDIEIGYLLHQHAWGQGYGTELARNIIAWGFQHLTAPKLVAVIYPDNSKSRHVLEKVGMSYVGRTHCYRVEVAKYQIYRNLIDVNNIKLRTATITDYPIIQNLARFYVYDISEFFSYEDDWQVADDGLYECMPFDIYWQNPNYFPFLIYYQNELIGFVIIEQAQPTHYKMTQFFISRKYKNKGVGRYVATHCFARFRGSWDLMVMSGNEAAYRFWRKVIGEFTKQNFSEASIFDNQKSITKNIFKFES